MERRVMVDLTPAQRQRCEKLAQHPWPTERLSVDEISQRLLLEHLLWAEGERAAGHDLGREIFNCKKQRAHTKEQGT